MNLDVFFFPFHLTGHMNPMVDIARLFADRGVKATIVTTQADVPRIQPTIDHANSRSKSATPIQILTIPLPTTDSGLLSPEATQSSFKPIYHFEAPFRRLLESHRPDFIVSDIHYPWTSDLGIPRIEFHASSVFCNVAFSAIYRLKPHEAVAGDDQPFMVPEIPHQVEITGSQLPDFVTKPVDDMTRMIDASKRSYGVVINSFYEMERQYVDILKETSPLKVWQLGPVSLCNRDHQDRASRGEKASTDTCDILGWLGNKEPASVLYICFGSLGHDHTSLQLHHIASGLESSGHPFIWVVRGELPEGLEERVVEGGKGLIINGWAPQLLILNDPAVGGFMCQSGWNSCLEGVSAGVPMITWPLSGDHFVNEKLVVDVLGVGIAVGSKVCSFKSEERTMVSSETIRKAVGELMGGGLVGDGMRNRAKELGEKAKKAMEAGGSSYNDMTNLIEDMVRVKQALLTSESPQP